MNGEKKDYNPPHFSYKYYFVLSLKLNNPHVKEFSFRLHELALDGGDDADGYKAPTLIEQATGLHVWRRWHFCPNLMSKSI